jgi:hypothetical protein
MKDTSEVPSAKVPRTQLSENDIDGRVEAYLNEGKSLKEYIANK